MGPTSLTVDAARDDTPPDGGGAVTGVARRFARAVVLVAVVVVPLVIAVDAEDVFGGPKLVALWGLLVLAWWAVLMGALLGRAAPRQWSSVRSVDLCVVALLATSTISTLLSIDRDQSLVGERLQHQGMLTLALYLGWFALGRVLISDHASLRALMAAVVIGTCLVAGFAIAQRAGIDPVWQGFLPGGRVFSTIGQPNALAAYLVLGLCATVASALAIRGPVRSLCSAAAVPILVAIALTLSRGGYLALGAALLVLSVGAVVLLRRRGAMPRGPRSGPEVAAVVVVGAVVVAFAVLPWSRDAAVQSWDRLASLTSPAGDESIEAHLDQWRVAAAIVADRPLVGTGPATYPLVFPIYSRVALPEDRVAYFDQYRVESSHNIVLELAAGGGLPVAVAWLATMVGVARALWRGARRASEVGTSVLLLGILAIMAGTVVANSFMTAEVTGSWLLWLLMGAGVGVVSARASQPGSSGAAPG